MRAKRREIKSKSIIKSKSRRISLGTAPVGFLERKSSRNMPSRPRSPRQKSRHAPEDERSAQPQIAHALDVLCLRKHVQGCDPPQFVPPALAQQLQIARQGRRVARDINNLLRA